MPESFLDELDRQLNPDGFSEGEPSLAASLHLGMQSNPDQEAAVRRRAQQAGMSPELVRQSDEAGRLADVQGLLTGLDGFPRTQALMADPNNAAIAHDATESLTEIEREGGFFSRLGQSIMEFGEDIGDAITNPLGPSPYTIEGLENVFGEDGDIGAAFETGQLVHELGHAGHALKGQRGTSSPRVEELKKQMQGLGVTHDGFLGFLTSAAEILGQQYSSFTRPEAVQRVTAGGTLGAGAGLTGGPFAPITVPAGAVAGAISGTIAHVATDAMIVEGGHAYIDMVEKGVDTDTAAVLATGVGIINAGLEVLGTTAVVIPITAAAKTIAKRAMGTSGLSGRP